MGDKDRGKRKRESVPAVAYFKPKFAESYTCFGTLGHYYRFTKGKPLRLDMPNDIQLFRGKPDVIECDVNGNSIGETGQETQPLSYATTVPSSSAESKSELKGGSEILTGDRPSRKKKKKPDPDEDPDEDFDEDDEEEEEEKPKKKKKKKSKDKKSSKKKKKKKKRSFEEDDDDE